MTRIEGWCDGSGTFRTNEPACIGCVIFEDDQAVVEVSEGVDLGTNNLAELRAIRRTLHLVEKIYGTAVEARVVSDSEYALGSTIGAWGEPRRHYELILAIRHQVSRMPNITFWHVSGHSKIWGNELADWLASEARRRWFLARGLIKKPRKRPLKYKYIHRPEDVEPRLRSTSAIDWTVRHEERA